MNATLDVRDANTREQLMEDLKVADIWIEAEERAPNEWNIADDNTDVAVTLSDGSR